jgi:multimeric flavodoxin WrbA
MANGEEIANRVTVIMGSARSNGNTALAVRHLNQQLGHGADVADLSMFAIGPFDYLRHDDRDDFRSVIGMMVANEHIVFATPVYWYAMSGTMKAFFDRLTDLLLDPESRNVGRALAGRNVWLLATGTDETLPSGFHEPFANTATYFDMVWRQAFYCRSVKGVPLTAESLAEAGKLASLIVAGASK